MKLEPYLASLHLRCHFPLLLEASHGQLPPAAVPGHSGCHKPLSHQERKGKKWLPNPYIDEAGQVGGNNGNLGSVATTKAENPGRDLINIF